MFVQEYEHNKGFQRGSRVENSTVWSVPLLSPSILSETLKSSPQNQFDPIISISEADNWDRQLEFLYSISGWLIEFSGNALAPGKRARNRRLGSISILGLANVSEIVCYVLSRLHCLWIMWLGRCLSAELCRRKWNQARSPFWHLK